MAQTIQYGYNKLIIKTPKIMCLVTYHQKPMVASKDIKVYKHVARISPDSAQSPCQGTWFKLNQEFVAEPSETYLSPYSDDKRWKIDGGTIHACLWPDFNRGECLEAYIPKGTEYWFGIDKSTICAKKLFITDKKVRPKDCAGLDPEVSEAIYKVAPEKNGVRIGDFLVYGEFVKPSVAKGVSNKEIQGVVVGFNGNEPEVADIQHILKSISIDNRYNSKLHKNIPEEKDAKVDMNGYEHFKAWKETCENDSSRYEAYHAVNKLSENHYIPALGEMELVWSNLSYIAAGCSLANVTCPFTMEGLYWTSTEISKVRSWLSGLGSVGAMAGCNYKCGHCRLVPFVASANMKKM